MDLNMASFGAQNAATLTSMHNLADHYHETQRFTLAESLAVPCLAGRRVVHGNTDDRTLRTMNLLALNYFYQKNLDGAGPLFTECYLTQKKILGDNHMDTFGSLKNLALYYLEKEEYFTAIPLIQQARTEQELRFPDDIEDIFTWRCNEALVLFKLMDWPRAETAIRGCIEASIALQGELSQQTLRFKARLGLILDEMYTHDAARDVLEDCLMKQVKTLGKEHEDTRYTLVLLEQNRIMNGASRKKYQPPTPRKKLK